MLSQTGFQVKQILDLGTLSLYNKIAPKSYYRGRSVSSVILISIHSFSLQAKRSLIASELLQSLRVLFVFWRSLSLLPSQLPCIQGSLLLAQEWSILTSRKSNKGGRRPARMNKELLLKHAWGGSQGRWLRRNTEKLSDCAEMWLGNPKLIWNWIWWRMWMATKKYSTGTTAKGN